MSDPSTTQQSSTTTTMLTMPLALFRNDFYSNSELANGGSEGAPLPISMQSAWIIHIADAKCEIFKVEFPTSPRPDSKALLWLIADYRKSVTRRRELKCESEMYRQKSYIYKENLDNLIYKIAKLTSLSRDTECVITTAQQICIKNDANAFAGFQCKFVAFNEKQFKIDWYIKNPDL